MAKGILLGIILGIFGLIGLIPYLDRKFMGMGK